MPKRKKSVGYQGAFKRSKTLQHYARLKSKNKRQFTKTQERSLKDILKEAKKWQDLVLQDTALSPTMSYISPTTPTGAFYSIAQTDAEDNNRNGDTIRGTTLDIRGTLKTRYMGTTVCRLMLVQFAQRTGANINQVLEDYIPPAGLTYSSNVVDSFRKMNGTQKYQVLWDKKITMMKDGQVLPTGGTFPMVTSKFRAYVKLTPKQSKMTYEVPTATSPVKNPIYLYACYADTTGVTAYAPLLQYTARIRYVDV